MHNTDECHTAEDAEAYANEDPESCAEEYGNPAATKPASTSDRTWAIVELMGHRKLAGVVTEVTRFGIVLMRIDVYPGDATEPIASSHYNPSKSLYSFTECDEATARRVAKQAVPAPTTQFALPAYDDEPEDW